jgi:dsRNA-specific ribonuclease
MKPYLPVYQNTFLLLPSHLPTHARNIYLPERFWTNSKKKNESLLALIACVRLYELNVLNERLLPLKRADIQQRLQKSTLRSLKRVSVVFNQMKPETKFKQKELYIYSLNQQGAIFDQNKDILNAYRKLCIISFTPLTCASSFSLQLRHRQLGLIHCSLGCFKQESITSSQWETCNQFYAALMNFRWRKRSGHSRYKFSSTNKSIFPPYIVSCLSIADCLDWDYMQFVINEYNRSDYERKKAVQNWTGQAPRLFAPIYDPNNTYIAFKITDDKNCASPFPDKESDFESFGDYFFNRWSCKFSDDCKLVDVQRCWNLPSRAVEVKSIEEENNKEDYDIEVNNNCKGLVSVLLPKDACIETPIADPGLFLHSIMLPQILYELERMETMHEFVCHCSRWPILYKYLNTINLENITIAMTAKSCALGEVSYDRLEYLGDAVLKLIHTDALINSQDEELRRWFHCLHEGDLTELRNAMGCNKRLKDIAGSAGFDNFILTTPLGRGTWHPSSLQIYTIYNEDGGNPVKKVSPIPHFLPSEKVTADVIESILGLIYVHCGYEAATQVALELDISIPRSTESLHQMNPTEVLNTDDNLVKVATAFLGVDKMRDSSFVMEACTHPSKMNSSNYQRLEWIGDAVLCLASREWVYNHFQSFDVKDLVTIETILICNETLAMIAFSSGLQK